MKSISEIKKEQEEKVTVLFDACGMFFAFSDEQFEKNKTPLPEGEKYLATGNGGYFPEGKAKELRAGIDEIDAWFKTAIAEPGQRRKHIADELNNHEAYYTYSIEDTLEALGEGYTAAEVQQVFDEVANTAFFE